MPVLLYCPLALDHLEVGLNHDSALVTLVFSAHRVHLDSDSLRCKQTLVPIPGLPHGSIPRVAGQLILRATQIPSHTRAEYPLDGVPQQGLQGRQTGTNNSDARLHTGPDEDISHDPGDIHGPAKKRHVIYSDEARHADTTNNVFISFRTG